MAPFFRLFVRHLKQKYTAAAAAGVSGTVLSFSTVTSFKERDLKPVDKALGLEHRQDKAQWSHKFVLQQSSVLSVESCSVTLSQTVVALQDCAQSYCQHLTRLTAIISMTGDGLPIAYTQEEIYDTVVRLRAEIKKDKEQLSELDILFCYVSKLLDSVAETSYLVGADFASLQASSRLASAQAQVAVVLQASGRKCLTF